MIEWRDWGAVCAGTSDTKPMIVGANYITLDEVALEASRLLFRFVPFTIEEQIPVFIVGANGLKNTTGSRKKNSLNKQKGL